MEKMENNTLWEVYSPTGGGIKAYIIANDAKEAIDKFQGKYKGNLGSYTVVSVVLLGSVTL